MNGILVRYRVKPEHVDGNRELVSAFIAELSMVQLSNRYAAFTLSDGVSFVHLHFFANEADEKQFIQLPAFQRFEQELIERCDEPPVVDTLEEVGSYGWLAE